MAVKLGIKGLKSSLDAMQCKRSPKSSLEELEEDALSYSPIKLNKLSCSNTNLILLKQSCLIGQLNVPKLVSKMHVHRSGVYLCVWSGQHGWGGELCICRGL